MNSALRTAVGQGGGRVAFVIEIENLLQVAEGFFGENDHGVLRASSVSTLSRIASSMKACTAVSCAIFWNNRLTAPKD
jgi:hypothetical protein